MNLCDVLEDVCAALAQAAEVNRQALARAQMKGYARIAT
jgi:hypothetical protein